MCVGCTAMHSRCKHSPCGIMRMIQHGKCLYDSRYDLGACLYDRRYDWHLHFWTLRVIGQACRSVSQFLTCASTANEISTDRPLSSYLLLLVPFVVCVVSPSGRGISHVEPEIRFNMELSVKILFCLDCVPIRRTFGIKRFPTCFDRNISIPSR